MERRENQRFKIKDGAFIVHFKNIGVINNISLGGVCCSCMNNDFVPSSYNSIDIRCEKNQYYIQNFDIEILATKITQISQTPEVFMRQCHIQFKNLSYDKKAELIDFISSNNASFA